jgi:hypothetical protein
MKSKTKQHVAHIKSRQLYYARRSRFGPFICHTVVSDLLGGDIPRQAKLTFSRSEFPGSKEFKVRLDSENMWYHPREYCWKYLYPALARFIWEKLSGKDEHPFLIYVKAEVVRA